MPDNGTRQLQTSGGDRLCEIVSSYESLERTKIASRLYNGGYLMQTVGNPTRILNLHIRAWSDAERDAVNEAEAACAVIAAKFPASTLPGYILDAPGWNIIVNGSIYEADVKFVVTT